MKQVSRCHAPLRYGAVKDCFKLLSFSHLLNINVANSLFNFNTFVLLFRTFWNFPSDEPLNVWSTEHGPYNFAGTLMCCRLTTEDYIRDQE